MSLRTPSSATHVGRQSSWVEEEDEVKSESSYALPAVPLRVMNPSSASPGSPQMNVNGVQYEYLYPEAPIPRRSQAGLAFDSAYLNSAHIQRWGSMVVDGPPPGFVNTQPDPTEVMSIGRYTPSGTIDAFPYDRSPNLQKLTKGTRLSTSDLPEFIHSRFEPF